MKIVQIFPGKIWGGAEQYILDLGHALAAQGHEVVYLSRKSEVIASRIARMGAEARAVDFKGGKARRELADILAGADVVHIHDTSFVAPVVKAAPKSARVVLTRHIARKSRVWPWQRKYFKSLHRIVFVSDLAQRLWLEANPWMNPAQCFVVHNSIPERKGGAAAEGLRQRFGIAHDTPLLVFTGRVRRSKGCADIVDALGELSDLDFAMVFVGACKPHDFDATLMKQARRHGIADRIHFTGFTPEARQLIEEADIGLCPSIVREALGLSNLEFMQAGKCVITTDNGAQPEYITSGETGLLVEPHNPHELSAAIRTALTDPSLRERIGRAAEVHFEADLSYAHFAEAIMQAYK